MPCQERRIGDILRLIVQTFASIAGSTRGGVTLGIRGRNVLANEQSPDWGPEVMAAMPTKDRNNEAPLLRLINISKSFPGVHALRGVSLDIHAGEVHVILGQNGAGKSSLIKVLCGAYIADGGDIEFAGRKVAVRSPADASALGVAVIFQEFSLAPYLDIAQNIFLGRERGFTRVGLVDKSAMRRA